jgi:long-subunit fatty acid transport protein
MDYLFGQVNRNVATQNMSDGQYYKVQLEDLTSYSDFQFKAGFAYRANLKNDLFLNMGATLDLNSSLNANQVKRFATMDLSGITVINADTLEKSAAFTQQIPVAKRFGLSVEKLAKWMVGVDYTYTDWSKVNNNLGRSSTLPASHKVAIGGEYTPDIESISNYFKRTTYRVGASYEKTPYDFLGNGSYAVDKNLSFGVALPLRNLSLLNIAYQVGRRGLITDNGMEEQYHRLTLGLTFSDLWFQKQKIN